MAYYLLCSFSSLSLFPSHTFSLLIFISVFKFDRYSIWTVIMRCVCRSERKSWQNYQTLHVGLDSRLHRKTCAFQFWFQFNQSSINPSGLASHAVHSRSLHVSACTRCTNQLTLLFYLRFTLFLNYAHTKFAHVSRSQWAAQITYRQTKGVKYLKCHVVCFFSLKANTAAATTRTEKTHETILQPFRIELTNLLCVQVSLTRFLPLPLILFSLFIVVAFFYLCSLITTIIHRSIELKRWIKNQF